jgi:hypothetical protein
MSIESKSFMSTQNISEEATQQKKLPKIAARYIELEQFKDSDHHKGYFCYNCAYFVKPHHCSIVTDEGVDILGRSSGIIAPHGLCSMWIPNEKEIHGTSSHGGGTGAATSEAAASISSKSDESTPGVSARFSCEICSDSFTSREELRQHTKDKHSRTT